jgi:hypothetical protein
MRMEGLVIEAGTDTNDERWRVYSVCARVDAVVDRAVAVGATVELPVQDAFWGDRYGIFVDPAGYRWSVATPIDDPAPSELLQRAQDWAAQAGRHDWRRAATDAVDRMKLCNRWRVSTPGNMPGGDSPGT